MRRLLAIYSRSLKRIKLKYFLQYYNKAILLNYIKYQKLNNMFKKKNIKYQNHSKNNNSNTNNNNFKTINIPSQYSYMMNCSEQIILRPANKNMAFLMAPCYIVDNQDINNRNIREYSNKNRNDAIYSNYLTSRNRVETLRQEDNGNINKIFENIFNSFLDNNCEKNNKKNKRKSYNFKKIWFPSNKSEVYNSKNENRIKKKAGSIKKYNEVRKTISTERLKNNKEKYNYFFSDKFFNEDLGLGHEKNNLCLGDCFVNNSKKKIVPKNKNRSCILNEINSDILNNKDSKDKKDKKYSNKINRQIFSYLYNNNYLNNLKKVDNKKIDNEKKINKKSNILGIDIERKQNKNYRIFDKQEKQNSNNLISNSHDYISYHGMRSNKKYPYKKLIKNRILPTNNFSYMNSSDKNKNIIFGKGMKKISKTSSLYNNSNNSNSQTNNQNLNHTSTNYSLNPFSKDIQKINKNKKEENTKKQNLKFESGPKEEFFKDNAEKFTNNTNRISLQSISDSKMMELAGYYGYEDSSSENYQMNNIIHNKKKFSKKNN